MDGNACVHTSSPFSFWMLWPSSSKMSTAMPRPLHCNSPSITGRLGLPSAKQEMMSVPPEMLDRHTSALISRYTYWKLSLASGDPVDRMLFSFGSLCVSPGLLPAFCRLAMYFALVPKILMFSRSAMSHSESTSGYVGEPSYSTMVAPSASADTSQFHIIQPQVV